MTLQEYIERIERIEEERKAISADIRQIYAQAQNEGYEKKIIREIIKLRKKTKSEREEEELILETYKNELGM